MTKPPIDSREFALLLADFKLCDENKMGKEIKNLFDYLDAKLAEAYEQGKKENNTELARLTECLKKANAQAEHFERLWYLQKDATEWQPIETAPKDGYEMFLCWVSAERSSAVDGGGGKAYDVSQIDFCWWRPCEGSPDGGYFDNASGQIGDSQDITHWMKLPKEPT